MNSPLFAAADGTINFTGSVIDTACVVTPTTTVALGKISKGVFAAVGDTASPITFTISLATCPASLTGASVRFDGTTTGDAILALTGTTGVATGLGVAIYEKDSITRIPVGQSSAPVTLVSTGPNTLTYVAKYMSTAATVGAGTANASTNITIVYN